MYTSANRFAPYTLLILICSCGAPENKPVSGIDNIALETTKVSYAISCTKNGLIPSDSALFMDGGGKDFEPTVPNKVPASITSPPGMIYVPGGEFSMGGVNPVGMNDGGMESMPDARPVHRVKLDPFYMDEAEVTNAQFAAFVKATGYVTVAEQKPTKEEFPGAPEASLVAGAVVFTPPANKVSLSDYSNWWSYVHGADWRHPSGPESSIAAKDNYPVVQLAWEDAAKYAKWAGKRLPTEAEWEFAARGGKTGELYPWGNQFKPADIWMANIFQGSFPDTDNGDDGFTGLAPVKSYEPNSYGLYDMAGNAWEWCNDWYRSDYYKTLREQGVVSNPAGPKTALDPNEPGTLKKVNRGGSFLCTDQYCTRYMVGTRGKGEWRSGANHIGFRCVKAVK